MLFQTEVLAKLGQWQNQRKEYWEKKRSLWFSSIDQIRSQYPSLGEPLLRSSSVVPRSRVHHLRLKSLPLKHQLITTSEHSDIQNSFESLDSNAYPYVVDLMSMRCMVIGSNHTSPSPLSLPRPLPPSASVRFSFHNVCGLPVYLYFPIENGWPSRENHPLSGQYFYVPPNFCVALDSSILRPTDFPLPRPVQPGVCAEQVPSDFAVSSAVFVVRVHIIILSDIYRYIDHRGFTEQILPDNPRILLLRESDNHDSLKSETIIRSEDSVLEDIPQQTPLKFSRSMTATGQSPKDGTLPLGAALGKLVRRIFFLEKVFAVIPNVNLSVPRTNQPIKRAGSTSTWSDIVILSGKSVVAHCPGQVGSDGARLEHPIPVDNKATTQYVLSSGFIVNSYFPDRLLLKFLNPENQLLMIHEITDPGKPCGVPPHIQSKISKLILEISNDEYSPVDTSELAEALRSVQDMKSPVINIKEIPKRMSDTDSKFQIWQLVSFMLKSNITPSKSLDNQSIKTEREYQHIQRHAVVIQSSELMKFQSLKPDFAISIHSVVIKAPLYIYNGLPVPVRARLSDSHYSLVKEDEYDISLSLLLLPCTGYPFTGCKSLFGLFASFQLPGIKGWSKVSKVWSGQRINNTMKGSLTIQRQFISLIENKRQIQFEVSKLQEYSVPKIPQLLD